MNDLTGGQSLLILGENGAGKSTILRSIGIGLCDESSAAALFRELPGEFVRRLSDEEYVPAGRAGTVHVEVADVEIGRRTIPTRIVSLETFERVQQNALRDADNNAIAQSEFPWNRIFVSAYGAGARTQGTADYRHYLAVDAVYPLFNYESPLQNPELAIRRLVDAAELSTTNAVEGRSRATTVLGSVAKLLSDLLGLSEQDTVELTPTGITVGGSWGKAELAEMGDGYRATVTWVLDLLSWWFLHSIAEADPGQQWLNFDSTSLKGIVIIDEIEQHLHPRWQRTVIPRLISSFPMVQFIVTTHSPLCVVGTSDVEESLLKTVVLRSDGKTSTLCAVGPPHGLRADQVLTSLYFGLETSGDDTTKEMVERYASLAERRETLSDVELRELEELTAALNPLLGSGETTLERVVADAVERVIAEGVSNIPLDAARMETIRQLRELN